MAADALVIGLSVGVSVVGCILIIILCYCCCVKPAKKRKRQQMEWSRQHLAQHYNLQNLRHGPSEYFISSGGGGGGQHNQSGRYPSVNGGLVLNDTMATPIIHLGQGDPHEEDHAVVGSNTLGTVLSMSTNNTLSSFNNDTLGGLIGGGGDTLAALQHHAQSGLYNNNTRPSFAPDTTGGGRSTSTAFLENRSRMNSVAGRNPNLPTLTNLLATEADGGVTTQPTDDKQRKNSLATKGDKKQPSWTFFRAALKMGGFKKLASNNNTSDNSATTPNKTIDGGGQTTNKGDNNDETMREMLLYREVVPGTGSRRDSVKGAQTVTTTTTTTTSVTTTQRHQRPMIGASDSNQSSQCPHRVKTLADYYDNRMLQDQGAKQTPPAKRAIPLFQHPNTAIQHQQGGSDSDNLNDFTL